MPLTLAACGMRKQSDSWHDLPGLSVCCRVSGEAIPVTDPISNSPYAPVLKAPASDLLVGPSHRAFVVSEVSRTVQLSREAPATMSQQVLRAAAPVLKRMPFAASLTSSQVRLRLLEALCLWL